MTLHAIDENYRSKGFKVLQSRISDNFLPKFSLPFRQKPKKTLQKIELESEKIEFDNSLGNSDDIRLEVVNFIEKSIESLAFKFEKISQDVIFNEIGQRIQMIKGMIVAEVQEVINETVDGIRNNIEQLCQERIKEILAFNNEKTEAGVRDGFSGQFSMPEANFKNKYEENYEFIENLANNYANLKNNHPDPANLSGSFSRDNKPSGKKMGKKEEKLNIPRTDVSAVLQQFLKK